jgi:hypothetical protein
MGADLELELSQGQVRVDGLIFFAARKPGPDNLARLVEVDSVSVQDGVAILI